MSQLDEEAGMDAPTLGDDDLTDAHSSISYFSTWIAGADTKAGLLLAGQSVILASFLGSISDLTGSMLSQAFWMLLFLIFVIASGVVALVSVAGVIMPCTRRPMVPSRFSFPTVASGAWQPRSCDRRQAAEEAWHQAVVLAKIASSKHRGLKVATVATFTLIAFYIAYEAMRTLY